MGFVRDILLLTVLLGLMACDGKQRDQVYPSVYTIELDKTELLFTITSGTVHPSAQTVHVIYSGDMFDVQNPPTLARNKWVFFSGTSGSGRAEVSISIPEDIGFGPGIHFTSLRFITGNSDGSVVKHADLAIKLVISEPTSASLFNTIKPTAEPGNIVPIIPAVSDAISPSVSDIEGAGESAISNIDYSIALQHPELAKLYLIDAVNPYLHIINSESGLLEKSIQFIGPPQDAILSPDGSRLYVIVMTSGYLKDWSQQGGIAALDTRSELVVDDFSLTFTPALTPTHNTLTISGADPDGRIDIRNAATGDMVGQIAPSTNLISPDRSSRADFDLEANTQAGTLSESPDRSTVLMLMNHILRRLALQDGA